MSNRFYRGFRGRYRGTKRKRNNTPVDNSSNPNSNTGSPENDDSDHTESNNFNDEDRLDLFKTSRKSEIPYPGWIFYFDKKDYKVTNPLIPKIKILQEFVKRNRYSFSPENMEGITPFYIDMKDFQNDAELLESWPEFIDDLHNNASSILNCLNLAVHQTIYELYGKDEKSCDMNSVIKVKILNYQPIVSLKDLKIQLYGKMITTSGCVIRVLRIKHVAHWIVFACSNCKLKTITKQPDGIYTLPTKCDNCGGKKFNPVLNSHYTKTVPFQMITIQENFSEEDEKGRMPRNLDVELQDNLVNTCMPGDDITVTGILKMHPDEQLKSKSKGTSSNPVCLYIEAITVNSNKSKTKSKTINFEFNENDFKEIQKIKNNDNILDLFIRSLCPAIYGHEMVKLGLLLSLFGGSSKHANLRDDIHILIIGDPGLGKSQMLQSFSRVAPKGAFVSGNSSTASGLTVTLQREAGTGDFVLEPGALVLADKGYCCIDEFDKMQNQHQALLEAMEQQTVSVAKSGVLWCLPARTSIIAAANPVKGRYDRFKTLTENINMSQPLLSRFDVVFLVLDNPNSNFDNMLVDHVMLMHSGKKSKAENRVGRTESNLLTQRSADEQFQEILSSEQIIPLAILRKYIAYARQWVKPKLSENAANILLQFYLELRQNYQMVCGVPVFSRQLEALIRLTEARAKLELREECTADDAMEVIDLIKHTIIRSAESVPLTIVGNDNGKMSKNKVKVFLNLLKNEVTKTNKKVFSVTELFEIVTNSNMKINDFSSFILKLNEQGFLIKKGVDQYKVILDY